MNIWPREGGFIEKMRKTHNIEDKSRITSHSSSSSSWKAQQDQRRVWIMLDANLPSLRLCRGSCLLLTLLAADKCMHPALPTSSNVCVERRRMPVTNPPPAFMDFVDVVTSEPPCHNHNLPQWRATHCNVISVSVEGVASAKGNTMLGDIGGHQIVQLTNPLFLRGEAE